MASTQRGLPAQYEAVPQPRLGTARVILQEVWNEYRDEITERYIHQGSSLLDLMELMDEKYHLKATETQWKKQFAKWSLRRNVNQADAAHVLRLFREATAQGLKRQVRFHRKVVTPQQISRYIKKTKVVANEQELLATLTERSTRPEHITYEDMNSPPPTPYHRPSHQDLPDVILADLEANDSVWLNVPSGAVTPSRSRLTTPRSSLSQRSSFSSFEMTQAEFSGMTMDPNAYVSQEDLAEDEILAVPDAPSQNIIDDVTRRCAAIDSSLWVTAATKQMLGADVSGISFDASGYGYMSSTPVAMLGFSPPRAIASVDHPISAGSQQMSTGSRVSESHGNGQECEATRFLARCFQACICLGQSSEDGLDRSALIRTADNAIDESMHIFGAMIVNHDPTTLYAISILLAMFEVLGQLDLAHRLLGRTLEVSTTLLGTKHALSSTIRWMIAVSTRTSHVAHEFSAQELRVLKEGIETQFGSDSASALVATYNFGWALLHEMQLERARDVLCSLRGDCERVLGFGNFQTIITVVTLARVQFHKGDTFSAKMLVTEMIGRLNEVFTSFHPYRLEALNRQAKFLAKLGQKDEAEAILLEVVLKRFSLLGPANPRSQSSLKDLHKIRRARGIDIDIRDLYRNISAQCVKIESDNKLEAYRV